MRTAAEVTEGAGKTPHSWPWTRGGARSPGLRGPGSRSSQGRTSPEPKDTQPCQHLDLRTSHHGKRPGRSSCEGEQSPPGRVWRVVDVGKEGMTSSPPFSGESNSGATGKADEGRK